MKYKDYFITITGIFGSIVTKYLGGWDTAIETLLIFMAIDWLSGTSLAAFFKKSNKSIDGSLSSSAGFKGLARKIFIFVFVIIGNRLDLIMGTNFVRNAVIIAFCANELLSIVENAGLMGIPIPSVIKNAIEILKENAGEKENKE